MMGAPMITLDDCADQTPALRLCGRCPGTMILVTEISDPKTSGRTRLYECPTCQRSAFIGA
jgi:hypothetical protein